MPAKAGIQNYLKILDSRLRGNDAKGGFNSFYETIKIALSYPSIIFGMFIGSQPVDCITRLDGMGLKKMWLLFSHRH